jgi:dUTP pyrophosphatase
MDLRAAISEPLDLQPLERRAVPTGLRLRIPLGWEGQVRPRSGLALKQGLSMPNSPGTIDSDYRGELQVLLINLSPTPLTLAPGQRIAQLVFCPVGRAVLRTVARIEEDTARGTGGFGSTGH